MTHDWTRRGFLGVAGAAAAGAMTATAAAQEAAKPQAGKIKIVAMACSLRAGKSTAASLAMCLEAAKAVKPDAIETELIDLATMSIPAEPAAGVPLKPGQQDDFPALASKLSDPAVRAIIIGTPSYFSNMSSLCKALLERCMVFRKNDFSLGNKVGGVLAIGGSRSGGGQELAIQSVLAALMSQNMLVAGEAKPLCHGGASVWNSGDDFLQDEMNQATIKSLGQRVAEVALLVPAK
ncbi:MAG: flavodoxin family protein [Pirellulales bacterium]|nr:flavodoxin family protein [Pirellulales bacterium]